MNSHKSLFEILSNKANVIQYSVLKLNCEVIEFDEDTFEIKADMSELIGDTSDIKTSELLSIPAKGDNFLKRLNPGDIVEVSIINEEYIYYEVPLVTSKVLELDSDVEYVIKRSTTINLDKDLKLKSSGSGILELSSEKGLNLTIDFESNDIILNSNGKLSLNANDIEINNNTYDLFRPLNELTICPYIANLHGPIGSNSPKISGGFSPRIPL